MNTWVEVISEALRRLGGISDYKNLYNEIRTIKGNENLPKNWTASVRGAMERNSSDSKVFGGKRDVFYSVEGLGKGVWGLRNFQTISFLAEDINEPPNRNEILVNRIIRDTTMARFVKILHNNHCQLCGKAIQLSNRILYSEAHHIKPLGEPHNGPDIIENIIILCPNHHAQCDYGAIELRLDKLSLHKDHKINSEYINYHNEFIFKR